MPKHRVNEPGLTSFELLRQGYGASQIGNKVDIEVAGVGGTPVLGREICRIQVGDDVACSWVVTLAPLPTVQQQGPLTQDQGTPQLINDAFAIIEWGAGKGRSYAVVDWSLGQQFSVFGSYVSVRGVVNSLFVGASGSQAVTAMSAFVVPGRVDRCAVRTIDYGTVGSGGGFQVRAAPPFARSCTLTLQTLGAPEAVLPLVVVSGQLTAAVGTSIWAAGPGVESQDGGPTRVVGVIQGSRSIMPLPLGSNFLGIGNFSGSDITTARLRYELAM